MRILKNILTSVVIGIIGVLAAWVAYAGLNFVFRLDQLNQNLWYLQLALSLLALVVVVKLCTDLLKIKSTLPYMVFSFLLLIIYLVLFAFNSRPGHSYDTRRLSDVRQLASALEIYHIETNDYPLALEDLTPRYIGVMPPVRNLTRGGKCSIEENVLYYERISKDEYSLRFCLGEDTGGYKAGIRNLTPVNGIE